MPKTVTTVGRLSGLIAPTVVTRHPARTPDQPRDRLVGQGRRLPAPHAQRRCATCNIPFHDVSI
jgi:hypothetical protein